MMRILQTLRRRMNGEGGFTLVEAMISISILAVGAFAVAQATMFGLSVTRCPGWKRVTSAQTSSTSPIVSCPRVRG